MRIRFSLLLVSVALLQAAPSPGQQTPVAPDSAARPATSPAASATSGVGPDVILLTNGNELPARVLRITPQFVRYLPLPAPTNSSGQAPAAPDTLQLAVADIFMIRYANGTREVLRPVASAQSSRNSQETLLGLSAPQRAERGRQDSRRYYQPPKGVFWGTFAGTVATVYGGPVVGGIIALTPPPRHSLNAPEPALLDDPAYYNGYRKQAQNRKLGKAAAGLGVGYGALAVLLSVVFVILLSSTTHF